MADSIMKGNTNTVFSEDRFSKTKPEMSYELFILFVTLCSYLKVT